MFKLINKILFIITSLNIVTLYIIIYNYSIIYYYFICFLLYIIIMSDTLRKFNYNKSNFITINTTDDEVQFYNHSSLFRSKIKTNLITILNNFEIQIKEKIEKNHVYKLWDFGDKYMNIIDPSVRFALYNVGSLLLEKQGLTLLECTFYFIQSRLNFLKSITYDNKNITSEMIENSQFYKISNNLEESIFLFDIENNESEDNIQILLNCKSTNSKIRSLETTCYKYICKYLNICVVPLPSIKGIF